MIVNGTVKMCGGYFFKSDKGTGPTEVRGSGKACQPAFLARNRRHPGPVSFSVPELAQSRQRIIFAPHFTLLPRGVMVTQEILILSFKVRVLAR